MQPMVQMRNVWTIEDLRALDVEDWRRYEIVDGSLVVSPSPAPIHEAISARLLRSVAPQVPGGFEMVGPLMLDLKPSYRISDLTVVSARVLTSPEVRVAPTEVLLVVEVVSPGSVTTDRITKPAQYAAAGIGAFWRVETDPVSLTAYTLLSGASAYTEVGTWRPGQRARIAEPFPVDIDLTALTPPG